MQLSSERTEAHSHSLRSVSFSPDGKAIVSGGSDKAIRVWDATPLIWKAGEWDVTPDELGDIKWTHQATGEERWQLHGSAIPDTGEAIRGVGGKGEEGLRGIDRECG